MAKNEVIEILRSYIYLLRAEGISVHKAFLYGSYLSNTATNESDIDLMIVTENENDDNLAGKIWKLTKKVNTRIEPFLVGTSRFNSNDNSPLVDLVKRTGLEIV
ncbi:MAG TPA: nucleotidyltransferase domain-containing protein [Prolixibacteraceae bacterium]|nr:nucleotidyltransferase domain-containing protein [Prolixibacteraceae bacterium]